MLSLACALVAKAPSGIRVPQRVVEDVPVAVERLGVEQVRDQSVRRRAPWLAPLAAGVLRETSPTTCRTTSRCPSASLPPPLRFGGLRRDAARNRCSPGTSRVAAGPVVLSATVRVSRRMAITSPQGVRRITPPQLARRCRAQPGQGSARWSSRRPPERIPLRRLVHCLGVPQ